MKQNISIVGLLIMIMIALSCSGDKDLNADGLSYTDFEKNLKADMTYDMMLETFGQPASDIGSGIHIYVYILADSTEIWIGYTDKILYARHMDINQQVLHTII